jgi:hypothetical protein
LRCGNADVDLRFEVERFAETDGLEPAETWVVDGRE